MTLRLTIRTRRLNTDAPLVDLLPTSDGVVWVRQGEGFVGWGTAMRVATGTGPRRFTQAERVLPSLAEHATIEDEVGVAGAGLIGFGSFTFDDDTTGSALVVPRRIVGRRDGRTWLTTIDGPDLPDDVAEPATAPVPAPIADRVRYAGSSMPDVHWLEAVATAIKRIDAGEVDKIVLARDHAVWSREPFEARWLAARLTERFPDCFTFLHTGLLGATPELLVRRRGDRVTSLALAGSTPRGSDEREDQRLGAALLASDKDRREHEFAARSVADVLASVTSSLSVSDEPFLLRLDNVQHLATEVAGTLRDDVSALRLAAMLHPTAAVGGVPSDVAVTMIRELEGMSRDRYAGPVGWVTADGDGEFGIALRCAQLSGARARLFAGAGIVAGSLPEDELEETRIKLRAMQGVLGDV
jgi:menaquinone-specific isochorismate synthase